MLVLQQLDHSSHDHRKTMSLSPARSGMTISSSLTLAHVCKPHKSQLLCLAVDSQGLLLATGVRCYYNYCTINSNLLPRELMALYSSSALRIIMNLLGTLPLLLLLLFYNGWPQYVIMSLCMCTYISVTFVFTLSTESVGELKVVSML